MDIGVVFTFDYYEKCCCAHSCTRFCVDLVFICLGEIPGSEISGLYGNSRFKFLRKHSLLFPKVAVSFYIPPRSV